MTAPFTASNGWRVEATNTIAPGLQVVEPDGHVRRWQALLEAELRALVEYAATIGITAEPSEEA